jgi:hypothetical protein
MITDQQLKKLMSWARASARHEYAMDYYGDNTDESEGAASAELDARLQLYAAFGFITDADGQPVSPPHPGGCLCTQCLLDQMAGKRPTPDPRAAS